MARVKGTKGNVVSFQITGLADVTRLLQAAGHNIEVGADLGVIKAATFISEEVKESIAGSRKETKSVDSGILIKSIHVVKTGKAEAKVEPKRTNYPGKKSNTQDVATILEKGTSRLQPRRHFKNTEDRNIENIHKIIDEEIKASLKKA